MSGSIGKRFIAASVASGSMSTWLAFGDTSHLFKPTETALYEFVQGHTKKYGALPQAETLEVHLAEEISPPGEPPAYYYDLMQLRYVEQELKLAMKAAADKLGVTGKDPNAALAVVAESVQRLLAKKNQRQVSDFRDAGDEIIADYVAKYTAEEGTGLALGWPTLDAMTGGLYRGDLVSMVGRPGKGKTQAMLYAAHHAWKRQETCQMFVSMEMKPKAIKERLAALEAHVPASKLKNAELSTIYLNKLKLSLTEIKTAHSAFWVVDGNFSSTVEDIWMLARQLGPDGIWVDGAYLVKHPTERDRFKRVAENADLMKQELSDLAPTVASWQFAKNKGDGKKKSGPQTLDDIGYTDAIAQVSSLVLGMTAPDSIETIMCREVDILKGRSGEVGRFKIQWDWIGMDFHEIVEEAVSDLQYV